MDTKYAIEVLTERLDLLDRAYDKYVRWANLPIDSPTAIDNRAKANSLRLALKKLKQ